VFSRRIHAFEWNDTASSPAWLKESIVETLGRGLRWGRIYRGIGPVFAEFLRRVGTTSVLDLASGSGEPCTILIASLEQAGETTPSFVVSDLFPDVAALKEVAERHPGKIDVVAESVDATNVPEKIDRPARTIITAFHHFPPELAKRILADCVAKKRAVFIVEAFPRKVLRLLAVMPAMAVAAFANPFVAREHRAIKLVLTWLIPLIPLLGLWDAVVSVLRVHSESELRAMVEPLGGGFAWEYREVPFAPLGRATVFMGIPPSTGSGQAPVAQVSGVA
jgi:hypothetical protein